SLVSDNLKIAPGCDVNNNLAVTEAQTYTVSCVDQTNNNNIYFTANPNPQITSTGQTSESCSISPVRCYPDFEPQNINAGFASASDNVNQFYLRVWDRARSGSQCARVGFQQNFQQCAAVQCPGGGTAGGNPGSDGGGGCGNGGTGLSDGSGGNGCTSPIIIDTEGEGFHLTSAATGVTFDVSGTDHPVQMGWTDVRFHNAFLALPGPDGLVHNGKELFGNFTPQPQSAHPNGFIALAQYDKPENGGNGDGIIDDKDAVFSQLRLWIDENHDGICQPNELHRLPELGIYSLSLSYVESRRTDQFGNQFRYQGRVNPGTRRDPRDEVPTGEPGRWEYDVFFAVK
ncbi:MAG TPA: hypothetical protein VI685_20710, partial [Candidatus Angelobacter sp.]